jgi:DNA polymerase I-like protein with 3'-5' exonuclease and polymerase domains
MAGGKRFKAAYKCFWPAADPDPEFRNRMKAQLVLNSVDLRDYLARAQTEFLAVDTETSTLDFSANKPLVGFSVSIDGESGVYVPLRHTGGVNTQEPVEMLNILQGALRERKILMYNAGFDIQMLETDGIDFTGVRVFDVQVLVFNSDTNILANGLKWSTSWYLGREVPTFKEVMGGTLTNFAETNPQDSAYYACCDTANTFALYGKLRPRIEKECPVIMNIDAALARCFHQLTSVPITIDSEAMAKADSDIMARIREIEAQIFRRVGYPFRPNSRRDLSVALLSIGLDTGEKTTRGDMRTGEEFLLRIKDPISALLIDQCFFLPLVLWTSSTLLYLL